MNNEQLNQKLTVLEAENIALKAEVEQQQRIKEAFNIFLQDTAAVTGDAFFSSLVQNLAGALQANYIFVGELVGKDKDCIHTIAYWKKDNLAPNFEYALLGSPCATVIDNQLQYYPEKTWQRFPEDQPLVDKRIECYLGVPLFNSEGQTIGILVIMHDEISESFAQFVSLISTLAIRAAAELERKQSVENLRESEQRYRQLVEQSNDSIFLIYKGRFELINQSFCKLFEVTPEIVKAPHFNLLTLVDPASEAVIASRLQQKYEVNIPPERFEFIAQTINGRSIPVEVSISYIDYKEGTAVQGILRDLTQQKLAEIRQNDQRELAEILHEIGLAFSASLEIDVILNLLLEQVKRIIPYDTANVILVEGEKTRMVRARGYEKVGIQINLDTAPTSYKLNSTPTWQFMLDTGKPLIIPDITRYEAWQNPERSSHIRSWASVPIIVDGSIVAFLSLSKAEPDFYTPEYSSRLVAFAAQAALAWQNARLLKLAAQRADAFKATRDILRALNAALDIQEAFPILAHHLQEMIGCQRITIAQLDKTREWLTFYGLHNHRLIHNPAFRLQLSDTAATSDLMAGQPHIVPDITTELNNKAAQALYAEGIRSYISLPLQDSQEILGAFTVSWETTNGFKEEQMPILQQIVDAVALGMERSRLLRTSQYRSQELDLLYQVISAAASGLSKEEILQTCCMATANFLNTSHVTLCLRETTSTPINFDHPLNIAVGAQFIAPEETSLIGRQLTLEKEGYLLNQLRQSTAPIYIESINSYTSSSQLRQLSALYRLACALIIPVPLRGNIIGLLAIGHHTQRIFTETEIRLLQTVAEELGRVLEVADLHDQLRQHAAELERRVIERTRELAEANEQLKDLDKMKSRFVSDVSHELRTPVTNLKLYLDLLEHRGVDLLDNYLPILQKQTERLSQLIQDILDLSRLQLDQSTINFSLFDLNNLTTEIVATHKPVAKSADLEILFSPSLNLPAVYGERNQLTQVITNLLTNAINYSPSGTVEIKSSLLADDGYVALEVLDTGIGIFPEDLPHIFDRFYRGKKVRQSNIPGTGLGLAIANEIVKMHSGHLEVESVVDQGSTFRILLPINTSVG